VEDVAAFPDQQQQQQQGARSSYPSASAVALDPLLTAANDSMTIIKTAIQYTAA
jgi:hypothetical protein